ncbi:MAG: hypothetical protein IPP32_12270 [Bacteroidetes bacterium]|nr:hypothetical protein [Bacteroidota bacterium]
MIRTTHSLSKQFPSAFFVITQISSFLSIDNPKSFVQPCIANPFIPIYN